MTKVSSISESSNSSNERERLEAKKKSSRESLEDKQMKRYFRSLKRKARKEGQTFNVPSNDVTEVQGTKKKIKTKSTVSQSKIQSSESHSKKNSNDSSDVDSKQWVQEMNKKNKKKTLESIKVDEAKAVELNPTSPEFSPALYWREPIPEVEILDFDQPKPSCSEPKLKKPKTNEISRALQQDSSVWLDKYKYEDAESKYFSKSPSKSSEKNALKKTDKEKKSVTRKETENAKKNSKDDRTLEDHIADFKSDNQEFRKNLLLLTGIVSKLQERVSNLEQKPCESQSQRRLSGQTDDEGVDLSDIPKCPLSKLPSSSDDLNASLSPGHSYGHSSATGSLNSGSEFEEFLPIKGKQNQRNSPDAAWTETWDDLTTCQDLISVLKQKMDL